MKNILYYEQGRFSHNSGYSHVASVMDYIFEGLPSGDVYVHKCRWDDTSGRISREQFVQLCNKINQTQESEIVEVCNREWGVWENPAPRGRQYDSVHAIKFSDGRIWDSMNGFRKMIP